MQRFRRFTNAPNGVNGLLSVTGGTALADNKVVRGDGTTGIQGSGVVLSDADAISNVTQLTVDSLDLNDNDLSSTTHIDLVPTGDVRVTTGNLRTETGWMISPAAFKVKAADQSVTDSTTLVDDTELSVTLVSGQTYKFTFILRATTLESSGMKVSLGGTATHTDLISTIVLTKYDPYVVRAGNFFDTTTVATHTLSYDFGDQELFTATIEGTTTVNAGGTFLVKYAGSLDEISTDVLTVLRGSTLEVWNIEA